ncbi:hypothetical protein M758_UG333700 [Ceratodon purpureus]|nr:hypothetical protein M758_UG333700 [Ceratodon purpureus]
MCSTTLTSIPQDSSRSPESTTDHSAVRPSSRRECTTDIANTALLPTSSEKRKAISTQEEPDNDEDFSNGGFSDDLNFMTQPPSKATRSHKSVTQKKSTIPKKYLKTKGLLHYVPPVAQPSVGRINPRSRTDHSVACKKPVWILHLEVPGLPVAYGKSGISWKSTRKNQQHTPCDLGQQMVQVHHVYDESVSLMFPELERQPFTKVVEAKVPQGNSHVYVKWAHHLLVRDLEADDLPSTKP